MKTRLIICAGITTGVVVTGVFLQGTWLAEPKYQGKPISYWIYQVAMPGKKMELGCKTIKEAGADAIPSLIKALQKKDSVLKRIYISVWWQYRLFHSEYCHDRSKQFESIPVSQLVSVRDRQPAFRNSDQRNNRKWSVAYLVVECAGAFRIIRPEPHKR